jgi:tetratricopeptide (TPR) repeat protein
MKVRHGRLWPVAIAMRRNLGHILSGATAIAVFAGAAPTAAQSGEPVSRAVVQPLPPPSVSNLGDALRRLARNARDVDALIDAGYASLDLNDIEAAIGFFGRAQELSPENARVKLGLAGAFVRSGRPIEALRLFEEAERAGVSTATLASARGLAYDLVGDNAAAQVQYRQALGAEQNDETVRRLAISQAIAGDREGFEATLYPQLAREDYAGFRTRAFGLAILGNEEEAVAIAETVMPRDLSARIAPYLRYMRRLTKAQQAAAANLGAFPRAAQIGRDDPRIAQYSGGAPATAGADTRLAPTGEPLGSRSAAEQPAQQVASAGATPTRAAPQAMVSRPVVQEVPEPEPQPARTASATPAELPPAQPGQMAQAPQQVAQAPQQVVQAPQQVAQPPARVALAATPAPAPGFDLSTVAASTPVPSSSSPATNGASPANVADAFAGFKLGPEPSFERSTGAVDITLIEPPREVAEKPPARPKPPAHPRRFWVQVATGRDLSAFRYDWRRISRKAPEILGDFKPMTTPWVEANRLLAGPFESEKAAEEAVGKLREAGLDSFTFTSEEGQEIVPLG